MNPFENLPHSDDEEITVKEHHKPKKAPRQEKGEKKDKPIKREPENKNDNLPSRTRDNAMAVRDRR